MKSLQEHLMETISVNESKIKTINDELHFWEDPKTEKEIIKKSGLAKDFVHAAIVYLKQCINDTFTMGEVDDWSLEGTIQYLTDDFAEYFTGESWVYKDWGNTMIRSKNGDIEFDDAAELFGETAAELLEKLR